MSQMNTKKGTAENPNRKQSLYLVNIIILSCLTIGSLIFALFVFFRLRTQGSDGFREFYTPGQIRNIEEEAAEDARNELRMQIQSSLESGRSTTQMLREIFSDSIVVVSGGRYYFYPLLDEVEKNPLQSGELYVDDGVVVYGAEDPSVQISRGILLSENNGKIDWDRLGDSGIQETVVSAGILEEDAFIPDEQFERNCRYAVEKGIRVTIGLDVKEAASEAAVGEAMTAIREVTDLYGVRELPQEDEGQDGILSSRAEQANKAYTGSEAADTDSDDADSDDADSDDTDSDNADSDDTDSDNTASNGAVDGAILIRLHTEETVSGDDEAADWTSCIKRICETVQSEGFRPLIGTSLYTSAARIDLSGLGTYKRWLIDHEETAAYPYSFQFWEYSAEGDMEGVPGKSTLYVRIDVQEEAE